MQTKNQVMENLIFGVKVVLADPWSFLFLSLSLYITGIQGIWIKFPSGLPDICQLGCSTSSRNVQAPTACLVHAHCKFRKQMQRGSLWPPCS